MKSVWATATVGLAGCLLNLGSQSQDAGTTCGPLQPGMALFAAADSYLAPARSADNILVGDFNGDGRPDVVLTMYSVNGVAVFLNTGTWSTPGAGFATPISYPVTAPFAATYLDYQGLAVADFNGDGLSDIAVGVGGNSSQAGAGAVDVLLSASAGGVGPPVSTSVGSDPLPTVGDLNGDGKPDLVVIDLNDRDVRTLLNAGDGSFTVGGPYAIGDGGTSVAIADFNGDQNADLAIANRYDGTVSVLYGTADGGYLPQAVLRAGLGAGIGGPFAIAAADVDGDGQIDLVVSNYACGNGAGDAGNCKCGPSDCPSTVSVLLNTGASFGRPIPFDVGVDPEAVIAVDLNGDGRPDLAVTNRAYMGSAQNTISVLLNSGSWTLPDAGFAPQVTYTVGLNPTYLAAADFNGDGRLDLVVANLSDLQSTSSISVLLGACP